MTNWIKSHKRVTTVMLTLLLLATLTACGKNSPSTVDEPTTSANSAHGGREVITVSATTATAKQVPRFLQVNGSFTAFESSDIAPAVSGTVVATPVDVGDYVNKGDVIARLDARDATLKLQQAQSNQQQAAASVRQAEARIGIDNGSSFNANTVPEVQAAKASLESAQAQARLAQLNATRLSGLAEGGYVSRSEFDTARTQAETAQAQVKAAREQYEAAMNVARQNRQGVATNEAALSGSRTQVAMAQKAVNDTVIRAPFSGFINDRPVAVGEYVTPTNKIASIAQIHPIKLTLQVPESEAGRVRVGMNIIAMVAAYPDKEFSGKITAIVPSVDLNSRALGVIVEVANSERLLNPGMFASAKILQPVGQDVVMVPTSAVIKDASTNSAHVFVIENNVAHVRVVQIGEQSDNLIQITSGLNGNEAVINSNVDKLYDGAIVKQQ